MVNTRPTPLVDAMAFADRLTNLRKNRQLTQATLAERANTHVTQIRRYEAGTSTPTLDVLRNLTLALNTSADSLLFDEHERGPRPRQPPYVPYRTGVGTGQRPGQAPG